MRGYGASRTPAARSQSGHDRLRPRFGFCLRATWAADHTGPHRTMITMNRIMELPKVTRLAKKNNFSAVCFVRHSFQRADNRGCGRDRLH